MSVPMVRNCAVAAALLAALLLPASAAWSATVGSAFTYQGSLSDAGVAPTGSYDFQFSLWDAASGGSQVSGVLVRDDLSVVNGVFTTTLDFGASAYLGDARWLQIEVRQGASTGTYTPLPRQALSPTPFAIGLSLPHNQSIGSPLQLFRLHNTGAGPAAEFSSVGAVGLRGITASTDYQAVAIRGEAAASSGVTIGVQGISTASPDGTGLVGSGAATGAYITGTGPTSTGVYARGYSRGLVAENLGAGSAIVATGQGNTSNATVVTTNSGTGPALVATGVGQTVTDATVKIENTNTVHGMAAFIGNNSDYATVHFRNAGSGEILWLEDTGMSGNYIVATGPGGYKFWVDGAGITHTKVLEILGGADLSERFDVADDEAAITPGMVVSIDAEHEGRLLVSREPYDHRVAGIVSGAGGVTAGMVMGQQGSVADGGHAVALTGRVYCLATASNGPIRPGDLLTTSAIPGHAMRVDDAARAQGAVLGKAMGTLEQGQGLVLVLVGLQ